MLTENLLHIMEKIDSAVSEVVLQGFLRLHQAHLLRTEGRGASLLRLRNFFYFLCRIAEVVILWDSHPTLPPFAAVLGIRDILVRIRIRIRGSVPLTNGSGSNSKSDSFLQ